MAGHSKKSKHNQSAIVKPNKNKGAEGKPPGRLQNRLNDPTLGGNKESIGKFSKKIGHRYNPRTQKDRQTKG